MNDVALAETPIIEMRMAAMREVKTNSEREKTTLQMALEFTGDRMAPAPESAPHSNTMVYSSTYDGAQPIAEFALDNSVDASLARAVPRSRQRVNASFQILSGPRLLKSWTETQVSLLQ